MKAITVPRFSDVSDEVVLTTWRKDVGDEISDTDVVAEVETDKAVMEIVADASGVLLRQVVDVGARLSVGDVIAVVDSGEDSAAPPTPSTTVPSPEPLDSAAPDRAGPGSLGAADGRRRPPSSPLARRLATEHGLDIAALHGTGPGGRVVRDDVMRAARAGMGGRTGGAASSSGAAATPAPATAVTDWEDVPLSAVRRATATRLSNAATVPHFALRARVDAEALATLREQLNEAADPREVRISFTHLVVKICAAALARDPRPNASWRDDRVRRHHDVAVGVAVQTTHGLVVPVLHGVRRASLTEIATTLRGLEDRAREGRLRPEELAGGTFTVSNLGMYGVDSFTALLNPPQAAILAVGAVAPQVVAVAGAPAVRRCVEVVLTVDHRVLDGAEAAEFLALLVRLLEHPVTALV